MNCFSRHNRLGIQCIFSYNRLHNVKILKNIQLDFEDAPQTRENSTPH